ncbi:MAG: N-acetyl sugar amidotransferase [Sphingopyxis sp.]|uniref:N-acetyl sugar amidotransferase n=1 Tax=Sphingopyxis sp. TaxID=1908224 RepID=UPI002ABB33BF|nr:N-acetyl sugar amidotransferase [Sphingopyxis sp.]MDZ3831672.1 N-acetyl sugar amidotransferase [Sphingopyxis sp.]
MTDSSSSRKYQLCTYCVMDTSDPEITFDADGVCNHCSGFAELAANRWFPNEEGGRKWAALVEQIKRAGEDKPYDSILGLSGGVDSSYLALKIHEAGLRPLVVHVDAGWNSELAVANIEAIVEHCDFDLHTDVINWEDMRDLQLAFLRSGVSNQDVPQDHAFFASLYRFAVDNGIQTVFSGGNLATEGIFPASWQGDAMDVVNLKAIHKRFGSRKLKSYPTINFLEYYFYFPFVRKMRTVRPLNYMSYNKEDAMAELAAKCRWRGYGRKHGESLFTRLFQNHLLPKRFGYDKRRPHYSSLIVSGQMSRENAIKALEEPLYDPTELETDISYFCKKLRISRQDFDAILAEPVRSHSDFPTWERRKQLAKKAQSVLERLRGRKVSVYS